MKSFEQSRFVQRKEAQVWECGKSKKKSDDRWFNYRASFEFLKLTDYRHDIGRKPRLYEWGRRSLYEKVQISGWALLHTAMRKSVSAMVSAASCVEIHFDLRPWWDFHAQPTHLFNPFLIESFHYSFPTFGHFRSQHNTLHNVQPELWRRRRRLHIATYSVSYTRGRWIKIFNLRTEFTIIVNF